VLNKHVIKPILAVLFKEIMSFFTKQSLKKMCPCIWLKTLKKIIGASLKIKKKISKKYF
jgi:hypothetical protein